MRLGFVGVLEWDQTFMSRKAEVTTKGAIDSDSSLTLIP